MTPSAYPNRTRRTKARILELRQAIADITDEHRPLTVRHLFYLMVAQGLIDKTERDYKQIVIRLASQMREDWLELNTRLTRPREDNDDYTGQGPHPRILELLKRPTIPFGSDYTVDAGRWIRQPQTYAGLEAALRDTANFYRRGLWADQPLQVHFFCEKDAIAELVYRETAQWDVPRAVMRGDSSKTFLWQCAEAIKLPNKPALLYFLGDYDVKGQQIIQSAVERIRRYATDAEIDYEVLAITEAQIAEYSLPTRPEKTDASRDAVELDALPPEILRQLINQAIERHIPVRDIEIIRTTEASERSILMRMSERVTDYSDQGA
jgi:hypothetical protein